jgi:hypothetical protein
MPTKISWKLCPIMFNHGAFVLKPWYQIFGYWDQTMGIDSLIPPKILQKDPILNNYVTTFKSTPWIPEGSSDIVYAREVQGHRCFWNMISDGMSGDTRRKGPSTASKKCTKSSRFSGERRSNWFAFLFPNCSQIIPKISHSPELK